MFGKPVRAVPPSNIIIVTVIDPAEFRMFGDWAWLVIGRFHRQALEAEQRVRGGWAPEDVRRLRAAHRRLRFVLELFAPAVRMPGKVVPERFAGFARVIGRLRDHDILDETIARSTATGISDAERDAADMIRMHVRHARRGRLRRVERMLDGGKYRGTMEALGVWVAYPRMHPVATLPMTSVLPDLLLPPLARLWVHPAWLIPSPRLRVRGGASTPEIEALHALRRRTRNVRYLLEIFLPFYPPELALFLDDLIGIQTAIGGLQDDTLLPEYLREHFGRDLDGALPGFAASDAARGHDLRLEWEALRERYLQAERRGDIRALLNEPTPPAHLPKPLRRMARRWVRHQLARRSDQARTP